MAAAGDAVELAAARDVFVILSSALQVHAALVWPKNVWGKQRRRLCVMV